MRHFAPTCVTALLAACCVTSAEDSPKPAPPAAAAGDEKPPAAPADPAAPKAEEPPKPDPAVLELLAKAAKRQGTADLVGEKAPKRYRAVFGTVMVHSGEGDRAQTKTTESFALPVPPQKHARLRSEWVTKPGTPEEKRVILGHSGRVGWTWVTGEGPRLFTDPVRDAADIRDVEDRCRMLRLALRLFFLGNLASGPARVTLAVDREVVFPKGNGETRTVLCRVLERAEDLTDGEPALRLFLDAKTLDPVAVELPDSGPEGAGYLLTVDFIHTDAVRAQKGYPKGVRVPDWLELFELPPGEDAKPKILIQAGLDALVIDPSKVLDEAFAVPK